MNCDLAQTTVHGYFDGELDAVRAAEFATHLEACAQCQAALERLETLRARLQQSQLYEEASPQLRARLRHELGLTNGQRRSWMFSPRFWAPALAAVATALAFSLVLLVLRPHPGPTRLAAELIDNHVRSLQPGHLTDVQSTDQHTVKPWFDGKLDFIPPVADYSSQGFPLLGGRLDVADGHTVAALVYGRRKHLISLFAWPVRSAQPSADAAGSHQGYNWVLWRSGDMQLCLVSDAAPSDLRELKRLIQP